MKTENCPCGSGCMWQACCGRFIEGKLKPKTPEQLMRSRYSAYATGNIDYIVATMREQALENFSVAEARQWEQSVVWKQLDVIKTSPLTQQSTVGTVEFKAHYQVHGQQQVLHEKSLFKRIDGCWFYIGPEGNPAILDRF